MYTRSIHRDVRVQGAAIVTLFTPVSTLGNLHTPVYSHDDNWSRTKIGKNIKIFFSVVNIKYEVCKILKEVKKLLFFGKNSPWT